MRRLFPKPRKATQMIVALAQCKLQHHIAKCEAVRVGWGGGAPCGATGPMVSEGCGPSEVLSVLNTLRTDDADLRF